MAGDGRRMLAKECRRGEIEAECQSRTQVTIGEVLRQSVDGGTASVSDDGRRVPAMVESGQRVDEGYPEGCMESKRRGHVDAEDRRGEIGTEYDCTTMAAECEQVPDERVQTAQIEPGEAEQNRGRPQRAAIVEKDTW